MMKVMLKVAQSANFASAKKEDADDAIRTRRRNFFKESKKKDHGPVPKHTAAWAGGKRRNCVFWLSALCVRASGRVVC